MKKLIKKITAITMTALLAATVLTGCGSQSAKNDGPLTPESIKEAGKLVSYTEAANEPFEYLDDSGNIAGYDVEILQYICDSLGVELVLENKPFQGILTSLEEGKCDMVSAALGVTKERGEKYNLTIPIAEGTTVLIKRKGDAGINTIADLAGKKIGTQTASYSETDSKAFSSSLVAQGLSGADVLTYAAYPDAYAELTNNAVDAVAQSVSIANVLVKDNTDKYEIIADENGEPAAINVPTYTSWGFRKEDTELCEYFNDIIKEMKENGKLEELQIKYFGAATDLPDSDFIPAE